MQQHLKYVVTDVVIRAYDKSILIVRNNRKYHPNIVDESIGIAISSKVGHVDMSTFPMHTQKIEYKNITK